MNNLECVIAVLMLHREARKWTDEAVARDVLAQLGLDLAGEATNAAPVVDPSLITEAEVVAAEAAAKDAVDKFDAARRRFDAQAEADAKAVGAFADQAEARPVPDGPAVHQVETRQYSDGTSATGTPPLPALSPEQQGALLPPAEPVAPSPVTPLAPAPLPPAEPTVDHVEPPPPAPAPLLPADPVPPRP